MAGLPHFRDSEFEGTYPIAEIRFIDEDFPGRVKMVAFNPPRIQNGEFKCFWSTGTGWGTFEISSGKVSLTIKYGSLRIKAISLPFLGDRKITSVTVNGKKVKYERYENKIFFIEPISLKREEILTLST